MKPTSVASVRGAAGTLLKTEPDFTYVGRDVYRAGWSASIFGNPFSLKMTQAQAAAFLTRENRGHLWTGGVDHLVRQLREQPERLLDSYSAVFCYRVYLDSHPELCGLLPDLRGHKLGCWCTTWNGGEQLPSDSCHAVVLALSADRRRSDRDRYMRLLLNRDQLLKGTGSCLST